MNSEVVNNDDENKILPVQFGAWSIISSILLIIFYGFLSSIPVTWIFNGHITLYSVLLLLFTIFLTAIHVLTLFRVENARKLVVLHSHALLIGFPIGTVIGVILIETLKNKTFIKS